MEMAMYGNGNGMEMNGMEMKWNGWNGGNGMEIEWKWDGNRTEIEWNGMEIEWNGKRVGFFGTYCIQ